MRLDPARVSAALTFLLTSAVSLVASAQVMTLPSDFGGDLDDEQQAAFEEALQTALSAAFDDVVDTEGTRAFVGDATCDEDGCAVPIQILSDATVANAVVHASINGEDELYDFIVKIYDLEGGVLSEQFGDCMICPAAEALDAFSSTVGLACEGVSFDVAAEETPVVEEEGPAFIPGDVMLRLAASPEDAEIRVNGELVGTGRAVVEVAPQILELSVTAPGHEPSVEEMNVTDQMAGPILMRFSLSPTAAPQRGGGASLPAPAISTGMMLLGGVALVGGGVLLALDGQSSCDDATPYNECPEVYETTFGGYALTAGGGTLFGMGLGLLLFNQAPSDQGVALQVSPRGAQVTLRHRF